MPDKILIVEDDPTLLETLEYTLLRQPYEVCKAMDGRTGLTVARQQKPDLIVLDLMLPGLDGLQVCRILRQETSAPILILTARAEEVDKVVGLEMGADDYMTKPVSMREFVARVKAMLRRVHMSRQEAQAETHVSKGEQLIFEELEIDLGRREVRRGSEIVHLKPQVYELLVFLARNRGIALSRDLILERVWGWDFDGGTRTVDVHVRWLRAKIEPDPANPTRIITVRGVGYRFEG
jgi:DNA-binding response OmpR family regulator